jgi:septum formation protein
MARALVVLGSASPRRAEILASLRVRFVVRAAAVDEAVRAGETAPTYLERIVGDKLRAVHAALGEGDKTVGALLVADTSVIDGATILGKPSDVDEAAAMILRLSGRAHEVMTRFAIGAPSDGRELHAETVVTRVVFRAITPGEARDYAASGEGLDKAGAYAVQGLGGALVARVEGSYSNVVGLPACEVAAALEKLGLWSFAGSAEDAG